MLALEVEGRRPEDRLCVSGLGPLHPANCSQGLCRAKPSHMASVPSVCTRCTASDMETSEGAELGKSFPPSRATGYSGPVSCKGTNLLIFPLSYIGSSNSSVMQNMCC